MTKPEFIDPETSPVGRAVTALAKYDTLLWSKLTELALDYFVECVKQMDIEIACVLEYDDGNDEHRSFLAAYSDAHYRKHWQQFNV